MDLLIVFFLLGLALAVPCWLVYLCLTPGMRRVNARLLGGEGGAPCVFIPVVVRGRPVAEFAGAGRRMKIIAVVSSAGGAGKTTLSAALATLLARQGTQVVALDLDPQNMLATHLGLDRQPHGGIARHALDDNAFWHATTFKSPDDVLFVPFGKVDCAGLAAFDALLARESDWLARRLLEIDLADDAVAVIDAARYPSACAAQALHCADLVLVVAPPNPVACASLHSIMDAPLAPGATLRLVVNGLNPARSLHHDALLMLRECIGGSTVLKQRIHYDEALAEAFARGAQVFDDAPHAQAAHDLHGLANWLDAWMRGEDSHA